jgi:hypothetical protein
VITMTARRAARLTRDFSTDKFLGPRNIFASQTYHSWDD